MLSAQIMEYGDGRHTARTYMTQTYGLIMKICLIRALRTKIYILMDSDLMMDEVPEYKMITRNETTNARWNTMVLDLHTDLL